MNNKERIPVKIYGDSDRASQAVAERIAGLIRSNQAATKSTVLGLATGHTPVKVYKELIRLHREEGLDFSGVITFNLDEYWPIEPSCLQSYNHWMHENLFNHINIPAENINIPSGTVSAKDVREYCREYESKIKAAGGIDLQVLGIGRTGHIGFNEPGSERDSLTRRIHLDRITRKDASNDFFGEENVPEMAITMGVATILKAREIALLSFGEAKASIIRQAIEEPVSLQITASFLQEHPNTTYYLDDASAAGLTRMATPWLAGPCEWDAALQRQAVIWLALKLNKPILKLTDEDYSENGLMELLGTTGGAYNVNLAVFREQMKTITGWPGGKKIKKRILVLSPHPDDDVISMGGTFIRLIEQGHEVHVAYMVSGYLSVFDHDVVRHSTFVKAYGRIFDLPAGDLENADRQISEFLKNKRPGDIDSSEIQSIKGLIRRTEAIDAAVYCGLKEEFIHFLDLPFYNSGTVQKLSLSDQDVEILRDLLDKTKPEMVFAAGDLSDPHGTHRLCLQAFLEALDLYQKESRAKSEVWLYRGAWQEWEPQHIDMAVPFSPDELRRKRFAIFRHQSQKDRAMFPGPYDTREFWQRAEDRNKNLAMQYDILGLPEYHALEAFVRHPLQRSSQAEAQLSHPCREIQDPGQVKVT
jgi:glucosamine-6-phosphate deaminase